MNDARPRSLPGLLSCLQQEDATLGQVLQQAEQLYRLNLQLHSRLPEALAASVRLCNIRKNGVAVIAVPSQTLASQVYLHQSTLLQALQSLKLPVTRVSLRIQPADAQQADSHRALPGLWRQRGKRTG